MRKMEMNRAKQASGLRGLGYVGLSLGLWLVVEYLTVWQARLSEWISLMPAVLIQYLIIVSVFWLAIFRRGWSQKGVLLLMLPVMYLMEFLWKNPLLLNPYTFLPASLLLASIWGFLTFLPWWVVDWTWQQHKRGMVLCVAWIPVGFLIAVVTGGDPPEGKGAAELSLFSRPAPDPVYQSSRASWNFAGIGDPCVLFDSEANVYKMWLSGGGVVRPKKEVIIRTQYLTSKDGVHWTEHPNNPVLMEGKDNDWDRGGVETVTVLKEEGTYWLWYGGYEKRQHPPLTLRIGLARSSDGVAWTKVAENPLLSPGPPGSWDDGWVESPAVVRVGKIFYLWYTGVSRSQRYQIGLATSTDGVHWAKHPSNPVLSPNPAVAWENGVVYAPAVVHEGTQFRMWYVGLNAKTFLDAMRIGMATSPDGVSWTRSEKTPVLGLGPRGAWDEKGAFVPSVLARNGRYEMWYLCGASRKEKIGLAICDRASSR